MRFACRPISIVALRGGFGNQLFAWAYGQELERRGHFVFYDPGQKLGRGYALRSLIPKRQVLPIPAAFWRRVSEPRSIAARLIKGSLRFEDQSRPPESVPTKFPVINFHWGYWQSLDYFHATKAHVNEKLRVWLDLPSQIRPIECAVHVRRGDYVSDPKAAAVMGTLSVDYYKQAIQLMKQKGYTEFVVYSDDKEWAIENIVSLDPLARIATTNESSDFLQMANSAALVTANSSFSWWAAFIVSEAGGDVVSPKTWFADPAMDSARLVPDRWLRL